MDRKSFLGSTVGMFLGLFAPAAKAAKPPEGIWLDRMPIENADEIIQSADRAAKLWLQVISLDELDSIDESKIHSDSLFEAVDDERTRRGYCLVDVSGLKGCSRPGNVRHWFGKTLEENMREQGFIS